jgi:hypothetical protein
MPKKPRKFFAGPWKLVADPPPCDPSNPTRALAYCEMARRGQRCECQFDFGAMAEDLEELGLGEYVAGFEDELDADSLAEAVEALMDRIRNRREGAAVRLGGELRLLQHLADEGSGVKPLDEA